MKRSTLIWTALAIALVAMLAVACDRPVNPAPQNTTVPTQVGQDFPSDYTPPPPVPTRPSGTEPGKATTVPSAPTVQATAIPQPTTAPVPTTAPANPTTAPQSTTVPAATPTSTSSPATGGETTYTVQPGDTLFRIALAYGLSWETVAQYNGITNPNAIYVGQVIKIPATGAAATPAPTAKTYVVQPGDNLFRIALAYGYSYLTVAEYNGISWPYWVYPGQVIRFP